MITHGIVFYTLNYLVANLLEKICYTSLPSKKVVSPLRHKLRDTEISPYYNFAIELSFYNKVEEMWNNSTVLNKMSTLMNALMHKVCVRAAVLHKNIKFLRISV